MSLFTSIANKLRSITSAAKVTYNKAQGRGITVQMIDQDNFFGRANALASISETGALGEAFVGEIASRYVTVMREELEAIRASGALIESISSRRVGVGHYEVGSDSPYAMSWLPGGNSGRPPIEPLIDWIGRTAGLSGYGYNEAKRLAYAIQQSNIRHVGVGRTGTSRLTVSADGSKVFDYRGKAHERMTREVRGMGVPIKEII